MAHDGELTQLVDQARSSRPGVFLQGITAPIRDKVDFDPASLVVSVTELPVAAVAGQAAALAKNVALTLLNFTSCWSPLLLLPRRRAHGRSHSRAAPMERTHKRIVFTRLYDTLTAVVQGMVLTGNRAGTLAGIGYWLIADLSFASSSRSSPASRRSFRSPVPRSLGRRRDLPASRSARSGRAIGMALWGALSSARSTTSSRPSSSAAARAFHVPAPLRLLGGLNVYGFLGVFLAPVDPRAAARLHRHLPRALTRIVERRCHSL
jgi:hypothetical protein